MNHFQNIWKYPQQPGEKLPKKTVPTAAILNHMEPPPANQGMRPTLPHRHHTRGAWLDVKDAPKR